MFKTKYIDGIRYFRPNLWHPIWWLVVSVIFCILLVHYKSPRAILNLTRASTPIKLKEWSVEDISDQLLRRPNKTLGSKNIPE